MRGIRAKIVERIQSEIGSMWTACLGVVTKAGTTVVDVQVKNKLMKDGEEITFPIIKNVPVLHYKTSNFYIASPLEVGDVVLLVFLKFNSNDFLDTANMLQSPDGRMFNFNDVICISGFFLTDETPVIQTGEAVIKHKSGSYIRFSENGGITIASKGEVNIIEI